MTKQEAAQILGIPVTASESEIKKAFRKKAMALHPDRNKAPNARSLFIEVHEAYEYLIDLKQGRIPKSYSRSRNESTQSAKKPFSGEKFRGSHYRQRRYHDPYAWMSREEFERRYEQAKKAARAEFERKSKNMYHAALSEYQNSWRYKFAKVMAGVGIVLALLFTLDYFLGTTTGKLDWTELKPFKINDGTYDFHYVSILHAIYSLETGPFKNESYLQSPLTKVEITRTKIFKDITHIKISHGNRYIELEPAHSIYGSFPLAELFLLLPFLSFFFIRPSFNFVFFAVNFNIYVFPAFILFILIYDGRILRLFGL